MGVKFIITSVVKLNVNYSTVQFSTDANWIFIERDKRLTSS